MGREAKAKGGNGLLKNGGIMDKVDKKLKHSKE